MRNSRIIIPKDLRQRALEIVHEGHMGIRKTKELFRTNVCWPGLDKEVEQMIQDFIPCIQHHTTSSLEPLNMTKMPPVWEVLHIDLLENLYWVS